VYEEVIAELELPPTRPPVYWTPVTVPEKYEEVTAEAARVFPISPPVLDQLPETVPVT
jgi:hypothetical protein